jgi:hypothetical protein
VRKIWPSPEYDPRTVPPVACSYKVYVIPAPYPTVPKTNFHRREKNISSRVSNFNHFYTDDNIKIYLKKRERKKERQGESWIYLAQNKDEWRALLNTALHLRWPISVAVRYELKICHSTT